MIEYSFGDYELEFEPQTGTTGELEVWKHGSEDSAAAKIDLSSTQARTRWANEAAEMYPETFTDTFGLKRALAELYKHAREKVNIAEAKKAAGEDEEEDEEEIIAAAAAGTEAYEKAMEILQSEDVIERFAQDMAKLGHVGEWDNKKLAGVCAVSARAEFPIQPSTHAVSSAGKNALWDTATSLLPPELLIKRSGITAKALFRTSESLKHRVLYIQEREGSSEAEYSLRVLQSDGGLEYEATEKMPDGTLTTVVHKKEGPCVVIQTTTRNHLHPENETRVVPIYLDESAEQTARINAEAKKRAAGKGRLTPAAEAAIREPWHEAIRLLQPAPVVVPYAERIEIPSTPIRLRRDFPQLLNIIKIVTWIHQYNREKDKEGQYIATEADFRLGLEIVSSSLLRAWVSLSPSEERVLEACKALPKNLLKVGFKRADVEKKLQEQGKYTSHTSLKDALAGLVGNGYLEVAQHKGPTGNTYTVPERVDITNTIRLEPPSHSVINEKQGESGIGKPNPMADTESGHYQPSAITEDEEPSPNGLMADNGRNGIRPLKSPDLQVKSENGRMAEKDTEKEGETSLGHYKFLD